MKRALILLITTLSLNAAALDSGWLEQKAGEHDDKGFSIQSISFHEQDGKLITVAVPKKELPNNREGIEEIIIIGKAKQEKESILKKVSYEWTDDVENDHYGLIIKLNDDSKMPLRLRFATDKSLLHP